MPIKVKDPVYPFNGYEHLSEFEKRELLFNTLQKEKIKIRNEYQKNFQSKD